MVGAGVRVVEVGDRPHWNAALAAARGDLLQSWEWGEFKQASGGWTAKRLLVLADDTPVAGAQILARSVFGVRFLYAPRGPWWSSSVGLSALAQWVRRAYRWRAPLLRADPPVARADDLAAAGFRRAPREFQPRATFVVDLTGSAEELLARFATQVRYNTRLAERKGVDVQVGGAEAVDAFWNLYASTAGRKHFEWRARSYFAALMAAFGARARILLAYRGGEPLAGALVILFGETAYYLYGASGGDRSVKPAELLQYRAMLWAKDQGATRYDMWGIPAHPTEDNPLYGVYRFKSGFGGQHSLYVGAMDLSLIPLMPRAPQLAETLALKARSLTRGDGFRLHDHLA